MRSIRRGCNTASKNSSDIDLLLQYLFWDCNTNFRVLISACKGTFLSRYWCFCHNSKQRNILLSWTWEFYKYVLYYPNSYFSGFATDWFKNVIAFTADNSPSPKEVKGSSTLKWLKNVCTLLSKGLGPNHFGLIEPRPIPSTLNVTSWGIRPKKPKCMWSSHCCHFC